MVIRAEKERLAGLLKETIKLMCKNGLTFSDTFSVEALIGITLDKDDVFLISVNEDCESKRHCPSSSPSSSSDDEQIAKSGSEAHRRKRKRRRVLTTVTSLEEKPIIKDSDEIVIVKCEELDEPQDSSMVDNHDIAAVSQHNWPENLQVNDASPESISTSVASHRLTHGYGDWGGGGQDLVTNITQGHSEHQHQVKKICPEAGPAFSQVEESTDYQDESKPPKKELHTCELCGKIYKQKYELKEHYKRFHGGNTLVCDRCSKTFTSRSGLHNHFKIKHGKGVAWQKQKVTCSECGNMYTGVNSLKEHIKTIHRGMRYSCNKCSKQYLTRAGLTLHEKRSHQNITSTLIHACHLCTQTYKDKYDLKQHIAICHEGKRLFCKMCNREYASRSGLHLHMTRKHKGD